MSRVARVTQAVGYAGPVDAPPRPALARGADRVAFFLLSAGAAAEPLLVPRTHDDHAYRARAAAELVSLTADDVYLAALPAGSDFAFGCPASSAPSPSAAPPSWPRTRSPPTASGPSERSGSPSRPWQRTPPPGPGSTP
ncbi:hypothetical protein ACWEPM_17385 [Streptomyces sp. NPDC004244]